MNEEKMRLEETVLVVDDLPDFRNLATDTARMSCREINWTVITAENGEEALKIVSETPNISLIITDINMLKSGGIELIEKLRETNFPGAIGVVSGTDVSKDFAGEHNLFYVGPNYEACFQEYEKKRGVK